MKKYKFKKDFGIDYRAGDRLEDGTWLLKEPLIKEGFIEEIKEQSLVEMVEDYIDKNYEEARPRSEYISVDVVNLVISEVLKVFDDASIGRFVRLGDSDDLASFTEHIRKAIESMKSE